MDKEEVNRTIVGGMSMILIQEIVIALQICPTTWIYTHNNMYTHGCNKFVINFKQLKV